MKPHALGRAWAAFLALACALPAFGAPHKQKGPFGRHAQASGTCKRVLETQPGETATILPGLAEVERSIDEAAGAAFVSVAFDLVKAGEAARLKALVDLDRSVLSARDAGGRTPLHWAAHNGSLPVLMVLVEQGADVNAVDSEGIAPIHSLAAKGHIEGLRLLLDRGANPDLATADGTTAAHLAAREGLVEAVRLLSRYKRDVSARPDIQRPR